ncbi:MAG: HPr kinase/phosphatase C-terminal domain-containing protein [Erythrobacter sp.]
MTEKTLAQISAVAIAGRAVLIEGPPGSGKSSLTLALIDRGAQLIGDDAVRLVREGDRIIAHPPANIQGKLEIRNVGLVDLPAATAPVGLVLTLSQDPPRYRESADIRVLLGLEIPSLPFAPGAIAPAIRAEWALRVHGLARATSPVE